MANQRLTDKTAFGGTLALGDLVHIVDISDTSQNAAGSSFKLPLSALKTFVDTSLYVTDGTLTSNRAVALNTFTLEFTNGNLGFGGNAISDTRASIIGENALATHFALKVQNGSSNPILYVRNDRCVGINAAPLSDVGLYIHGLTNGTPEASLKIDDLSGNTRFRVGNNGVVSIGDPWFTPLNGTAYGTFQIDSNTSTGKVYLMAVRTTYAVVGLPTGGFYCEINATNAAAGGHYGYSSIMTSTSNSEQSIGFFVDQTITSSPMNAGLYVYRLNGGTNKAGIVVAPAVNNGFGIGGAASLAATPTAIIHARGVDATSSNFGMKVEDSATTLNFSVRNDGRVFAKHLETTQGSMAAAGVSVRLGTIVTAASALDATRYIEHEINGTVYKLALIV
jgi:hypothetical protein